MSTKSLTMLQDKNDQLHLVMYGARHGQPSIFGLDLKDFLVDYKVQDGIQPYDPIVQTMTKYYADGVACLAAQIVAHFKRRIGDFYIYNSTLDVPKEPDYWYYVTVKSEDLITLELFQKIESQYAKRRLLFGGPIKNFNPEGEKMFA